MVSTLPSVHFVVAELQATLAGVTVTVAVGTVMVRDVVAVPIVVDPLKVVSVSVSVADLALADFIAVLIPVGIDRLADVPTPLAKVYDVPLYVVVMLCVKELSALVIVAVVVWLV